MSTMVDNTHVIFASVIAVILVHAFYQRTTRNKLPLPPGPPRLPIIGNLHNKPARFEWETYADWGRQYSMPLDLRDRSLLTTLILRF